MIECRYPNIEVERVRHNISQEDWSSKLGVTRKTYYNWINKGNIPVITLINMSDIFACSIDYLVGRTQNPKVATL